MLGWLTGTSGVPVANSNDIERIKTPPLTGELIEEYDEAAPETPAAMFAVKAFRTAIFGTPAPKAPQPRATRVAQRPKIEQSNNKSTVETKPDNINTRTQKSKDEKGEQKDVPRRKEYRRLDQPLEEEETTGFKPTRRQKLTFKEETKDDGLLEPIPFKLSSHVNLFGPSSSKSTELPVHLAQGTPARPPSPTKGILMTPGVSMGRRKAVTFDPTTKDEVKSIRVRSGLPSDFPGKFPSPWTPKTGTSLPKRSTSSGSLEETSLPIESASKRRTIKYDVTESSRIEDILNESDDEENKNVLGLEDGDLTMDMGAPKSASGKYWKEHAENLEGLALSKVDKIKNRCNLAIDYAKRKDEFCVNLSEKIRELLGKNRLLKNEIKRINQFSQFSSMPEGSAISDAMRILVEKEARINANEEEMARMQLAIDQYAVRLQAFEEMLDHREDKITELSMSLYVGDNITPDGTDSNEVAELKQKLRKARQEVKELGPLRLEYRTSKTRTAILEKEKENLEAQLESMKSVGDVSYSGIRSNTETRLRTRIDELEKEKRDLKAEMRSKTTELSKERREVEKSLRAEIADLKAKAMGEGLENKELSKETERLQNIISGLERDVIKAKSDNVEGRYPLADANPDEWQRKHRSTVLELRQAKEEITALRQQVYQRDGQTPSRLRFPSEFLRTSVNANEAEPKEITPPKKHGEVTIKRSVSSASDDSAVDRRYDRNATTASRARSRSRSPRKSAPPIFSLTKNYDDIPNPPLFILPNGPPMEDQHTPRARVEKRVPEYNFQNMGFTSSRPDSESFMSMKRQKASPRPSVVNWELSPSTTAKRKAFAVTRKPASKTIDGMDPARKAAAEKRIAERKAKRMAERTATRAATAV